MPAVKHEQEFVEIDGHGKCEVLVVPKLSSTVERRHYTKESFAHPAKMSTMLCREIIRRYTREGEVVLDPMAGIGTTLVESVLLGRNAVGVELEKKFCDLTTKNIKLLKKLKTSAPKGKAVVIKADSRELSRILGEKADEVIFSPPYRERYAYKNPEERQKDDPTASKRNRIHKPYSQDPNNIGNLKYSKPVDAIVTSPPFADAEHHKDHGLKDLSGEGFRGRKSWAKKEHVQDEYNEKNISKLKYGKPVDAIVTSPPFREAHGSKGLGVADANREDLRPYSWLKSDNPNDISNLKYGKGVDAIVTSPPFAQAQRGGGIAQKGYDGPKHGKTDLVGKRSYMPENVGEDKRNISNRPYGKVDSVIFSPPYANTPLQDYATSNKALLSFEREVRESFRKKGHYEFNGKRYTEREWRRINKGELKPRGMPELWKQIISQRKGPSYSEIARVDAVISSPPYSESMSKRRKGYTTHPELSKTRHMGEGSSDENIGNLRHGKVDSIITSPPYSEGIGHKNLNPSKVAVEKKQSAMGQLSDSGYSMSKNNIGNLPHNKAPEGKETYLSAMLQVYRECLKTLKPGGKMVLVLKDFIRAKKVVRLDLDTKKLVEGCGFRWVETKLFRLPSKSFWRTLYDKKHPEVDTSLLRFEFVEIFEKPLEVYA